MIIGGRPSKAALGRMKVVTVGVSIVAFLGSLGVIAGNGPTAAAVATVQQPATQVAFNGSSTTTASANSSSAATQQQPGISAPLTRSRGS